MSGNVHPNPGPIFPCSVCAGNVTWWGKSVQCCTCFKMGPAKVLTTLPRQIQSSWQLSLLELPPCRNTGTPPTCIPPLYNLPPSADAALSLHPRLQTFYPPSAHFISSPSAPHHHPLLLVVLLRLLCPPTLSGFFSGMLEVFEPGTLNYFTFFRPILSTLSAFRNPILTPLPLSGFLDSLFCVLIAPTPGLAFSLLIPRTPAAASSFSSCRAYPFLNFLPLSSLDPYSNYVGVNISLNNSSSVSFLNVYAPCICSSPTDGRTNSFSPSMLKFFR